MNIIPLKQGTVQWLRWRSKGIGGSDAAAILGVSPYPEMTPKYLWQLKTGQAKREQSTFAMRRGARLEPIARRLYEERTGELLAPLCGAHERHPWMLVSLDGVTIGGELVVEIKAPKIEYHRLALAGQVPEGFRPQLQHELAVSGAERLDYVSYSENKAVAEADRLAIVPVMPDQVYTFRLIDAEERFWACVRERREPGQAVTSGDHDPQVCGLSPETDCLRCLERRAERADTTGIAPRIAAAQWELLCRRHPVLRQESDRPGDDPEPLPIRQALAALMQPEYRDAVKDVLVDLLADDIALVVAKTSGARRELPR